MNVIQALNISEHNYEECLKCSICTAYCPVSAVEPKYPGPKHSGPDLERYRLKDPARQNPRQHRFYGHRSQ